jgi:glycosyltransferase involved in cell wall biosynthesis
MAPPENYCGGQLVMHRHLVERCPFDLHVVTNADAFSGHPPVTKLTLPYPLHRLRKSRFGPRLARWLTDYENLIWTLAIPRELDRAILDFKPNVVLTLAETGLCHLAAKAAKKHGLPLAGLFLDWFPIMEPHYGHGWAKEILSRRYRALYGRCDLAFCTSDGMQDVLGEHPNSHVIYPMPGRHRVPESSRPPSAGKFRLVYVGAAERFYGRMLRRLIEAVEPLPDVEIIVVGPTGDWPADAVQRTRAKGICLGFKPPQEAAAVLAGADALLVMMSFEKAYELFMRTSFTTKFLDYVAFGKPIILWGPDYCTPTRVALKHGGAMVVNHPEPDAVVSACRQIAGDPAVQQDLSRQARHLHQTLFNPERLQEIFVGEIQKLAAVALSR